MIVFVPIYVDRGQQSHLTLSTSQNVFFACRGGYVIDFRNFELQQELEEVNYY